ncbi:NUDIX domain-containing protein [Seiridium cupressi]
MSATGPASPPYTTLAFAFGHDLPLFTAPLSSYLTANPSPSGSPYEGIATGSFIINPRTSKLLLLRRAPHDSMPLCWEIPGGAVDVEDESILHGAARELFEETGLVATRITRQVGGVQEFLTRKGRRMGKVSFLVDVEVQDGEIKVKLDPNEHVQYVWVSLDEAKAKKAGDVLLEYTTEAQETTIYQAFRLWKEQTAGT